MTDRLMDQYIAKSNFNEEEAVKKLLYRRHALLFTASSGALSFEDFHTLAQASNGVAFSSNCLPGSKPLMNLDGEVSDLDEAERSALDQTFWDDTADQRAAHTHLIATKRLNVGTLFSRIS